MPSPTHVAAAVLRHRGKLLMCLRSSTRSSYPGVWDLPGGHVDGSETPASAIRRELREELDIEIDVARFLTRFERPTVVVDVFVVDHWAGAVRNAAPDEHDELRWVSIDELGDLALADAVYSELLRAAVEVPPEPPDSDST